MAIDIAVKYNFDFDKALANFKQNLQNATNSDYDMKLYDKFMEVFSIPEGSFEVWKLFKYSRYNLTLDNIHTDFRSMLNFLDDISAIVYDTVDDGVIDIVKVETVGKNMTCKDQNGSAVAYNTDETRYFILNREISLDDIPKIKEIYDNDSRLSDFNEKYDHLKISYTYLSFERFIEVLDTVIAWSKRKRDARENYAK